MQQVVERDHPAGAAQGGEVGVGPLQPHRRLGGRAGWHTQAAPWVGHQAQRGQALTGLVLCLQVAVDQHTFAVGLEQQRGGAVLCVRRLEPEPGVVKLQACGHQAPLRHIRRGHGGQVQVRHRGHTFQHLRPRDGGRQRQVRQAAQQCGLVLGKRRTRDGRCFEQQRQVVRRNTGRLDQATHTGVQVHIQRRGVAVQRGARTVELRLQRPGRVVRVGGGAVRRALVFFPAPLHAARGAEGQRLLQRLPVGCTEQTARARRQPQGQLAHFTRQLARHGGRAVAIGLCAQRLQQLHRLAVLWRRGGRAHVVQRAHLGPATLAHHLARQAKPDVQHRVCALGGRHQHVDHLVGLRRGGGAEGRVGGRFGKTTEPLVHRLLRGQPRRLDTHGLLFGRGQGLGRRGGRGRAVARTFGLGRRLERQRNRVFAVRAHGAGAVAVEVGDEPVGSGVQGDLDPVRIGQAALHFTFQRQLAVTDHIHLVVQHGQAAVQLATPGQGDGADLGVEGFGIDKKRDTRHGGKGVHSEVGAAVGAGTVPLKGRDMAKAGGELSPPCERYSARGPYFDGLLPYGSTVYPCRLPACALLHTFGHTGVGEQRRRHTGHGQLTGSVQ